MPLLLTFFGEKLCAVVHSWHSSNLRFQLSSKKRLTTHWKKYIRPLMWRCKWIELRMNECQSQALKYDKKLAAYSQRKLHNLRQAGSENSAARLVSLSCRNDRKQVMKRKRRKRLEDTSDLSSYMSQHNLFSYYGTHCSDYYTCVVFNFQEKIGL